MFTTLIDSQAVVDIAYSSGCYVASEDISPNFIGVAQCRYILPVVGEALIEKLNDGEYYELLNDYITAPLALYVRHLVNHPNAPASDEGLNSARQYMLRLTRYLEEHKTQYPEYKSEDNVLNRCRFHGGFVQVL